MQTPVIDYVYTVRNEGTFFTKWKDEFPMMLYGKMTEEEYRYAFWKLNKIRSMGAFSSIMVGLCYFLFLPLLYIIEVPIQLTLTPNEDCNACWQILEGAILSGGAVSIVVTIWRMKMRKDRLGIIIQEINSILFFPRGFYLKWDRNKHVMLEIHASVYNPQIPAISEVPMNTLPKNGSTSIQNLPPQNPSPQYHFPYNGFPCEDLKA